MLRVHYDTLLTGVFYLNAVSFQRFENFEDPMTDVLHVELREQTGTAATQRLRKAGRTPVVLYGHGEGNLHLSVATTEVATLLRHHGKTVQLDGASNDHALINELQFDPLGIEVLHLDLVRVNLQEKVTVTLPIHIHGEAAGLRQGGILLENVHEVVVRCLANSIPESIGLQVSGLEVGQSATASQLELPEGMELVTPADTVLVHIEVPKGADADATAVAGEPEVIGKRAKDEQEA